MVNQLVVTAGPEDGLVIPLADGQALVIGRGVDADPRLSDPGVSRRHLRVEAQGQTVTVTDVGSSGGTFVNGERIEGNRPRELRPGDRLQIGGTVLALRPDPNSATTIVQPLPSDGEVSERPTQPGQPVGKDVRRLVGQTLHVYQVREKIADGQSGVVYKAHDTKAGRDVALKVLWPEAAADDEQRRRFVRAMKTMFPLRHPHVIRIHDAGKNDGLLWVAMEYFPGESLTKVIGRIGTAGMFDWRTGFRVAVHIARALEAAHERQIIHRNITPQNILYDGDQKLAKLGDLMLAKALEGVGAQQVTAKGRVVGELAYLSPERLSGDEQRVDGRSDIYSLGATVYALLTGRPPFEGQSLPELLTKVRSEPPEKPKRYQLSIADLFEGVVLRMLEKRPEDRYQTPAALLADLDRVARYQNLTV